MNLRRVDLNLLVAFDALMQTRHVGRAGALLGLGQPAMSAALGRLRALFGDDLLVRQGGGMAPTDRALQIAPEVRLLLDRIGVLVSEPEGFDAATSARHFRLRLSDLLASLLLPNLLRRIERSAPGIAIEIRHLAPEETADALERGELDLAISADLPEAFARRLARLHGLVEMPAPGEARDFTWSLYWHRRHDSDPAQRWLRAEISAAAADLQLPELS